MSVTDIIDLEWVAVRLVQILGEKECLLVGAMAVAAHGYVRATEDIDLVTRLALNEARRRLRDQGVSAVLRRVDPMQGEFSMVRGILEGIEFDVLPQIVPLDWGQAIDLPLADSVLKVVDLDGLIRLKLRAQGAQDLLDVAMLLEQHPDRVERARSLAQAHGVAEKLQQWLDDPRLKAKAAQSRSRTASRKSTPKSV
jgi:hypothetical protein